MTDPGGPAAPRRRGRRDPWKAAFFGVAAVALAGGVAWALLGSSLLVVRSVQVTGASHIPRRQVLAAAGIKLGTPLIRIDTSVLARRVERITQVQVATVRRSWPDAVVIWIKRRTAVLAVPGDGGYALMDPYGVILGISKSPPRGLVVLRSAGQPAALRGSKAVLAAGTVVRGLPRWLRSKVTAVQAAGPADVTLYLRGGVTLVWGTASRGAEKAREVAVLLRTGATFYDVSDPTTAVTGASAGSGR
jgi:cell division septal protein FtsQ